MAYTRKTKDEYRLMCNYGYGWDVVEYEETLKDARLRMKEYAENMPQYPCKIVKKRVPLS